MIVDDSSFALEVIEAHLVDLNYSVITSTNPIEAIERIKKGEAQVVVTDIEMPGMTGLELMQEVKEISAYYIPIIVMSGRATLKMAREIVKRGAFDFLLKPMDYDELASTLDDAFSYYEEKEEDNEKQKKLTASLEEKNKSLAISLEEKNKSLAEALSQGHEFSLEMVNALTNAAELRDCETGAHIKRIGLHTELLSKKIKMSEEFVNEIIHASPLHDVGKIGIPDNILLKEGPLDKNEWEVMQNHTIIGSLLLADSTHSKLKMASSIALNHHEKWDGSGYPRGIKGEDIPIEARITLICDVYDALRSKRSYKVPYSHKESIRLLQEDNDRTGIDCFDEYILKTFIKHAKSFDDIFNNNQ